MLFNLGQSLFDTHCTMAFFSGLILATLTAFADAGVLSLHTLDDDVGDVKMLNGWVCQTTRTQNQTTGVCSSV